MIIESVAAASAALTAINQVITKVNETGQGMQSAMSMISSFGEALDQFEMDRRSSVFKPLSNQDILKIQMIRRSQARYEKDLRQLLLIADPQLLNDYDKAIREREEQRKQHHNMLIRKKKQREKLVIQILVGGTTLLVGIVIIVFGFVIFLNNYK
jgi:hypothetical protein|tara:strand:- start:83 stop:547 length:465 start_codon:yes stop_codon:yes gene_type:complete